MFKQGDYIVCLNTPIKDKSFPRNHIFKQRIDKDYLMSELDMSNTNTNGWRMIDFNGQNGYGKWRYATQFEIVHYELIGKPFNITKLKGNNFTIIEENVDYLILILKRYNIK